MWPEVARYLVANANNKYSARSTSKMKALSRRRYIFTDKLYFCLHPYITSMSVITKLRTSE